MNLVKLSYKISKVLKHSLSENKNIFRNQTYSFVQSQNIVRLFYALSIYIVFKDFGLIHKFSSISTIDPLWPVFWVSYFEVPQSFNLLFFSALIGSIICCLNPNNRIYRLVFFIAFFEYLAFKFSFGKINHATHPWLFISFFLVFLPHIKDSGLATIKQKHIYLTIIWFCIFMILFFYSISGFWKVYKSLILLISGKPSIFSMDVFAIQISNRLLQTQSTSLMGPFFIKHHFLGWVGYLISIYVELVCFIVAFRPSLHRIWGIMLIVFHIGIKLTMNISFKEFIISDSLLLVCSPFAGTNIGYKKIILQIPILSFFISFFNKNISRK